MIDNNHDPRFQQVEDHKHLVRDKETNAILNRDQSALLAAKHAKHQRLTQKATLEAHDTALNTLSNRLGDLEDLLHQILDATKKSPPSRATPSKKTTDE